MFCPLKIFNLNILEILIYFGNLASQNPFFLFCQKVPQTSKANFLVISYLQSVVSINPSHSYFVDFA